MDITKLQTTLTETFSANFVSYYRAHAAHINVVGRNFYADHKLLEKAYTYFQDNIDTIGEKLRTVRAPVPNDIMTIIGVSPLADTPVHGDATDYLATVLDSIDVMIDQYHAVYESAEAVDYIDISNFAQDEIGKLAKLRWQIEATLDMLDQ